MLKAVRFCGIAAAILLAGLSSVCCSHDAGPVPEAETDTVDYFPPSIFAPNEIRVILGQEPDLSRDIRGYDSRDGDVPVEIDTSELKTDALGYYTIKCSAEDKAGSMDPLLADILPVVKEAFESQLTPEGIRATMDSYSALERNPFIRVVPLWVKDFVIGRYSTRTRKGVTATLSNLGRIRLAEPIAGYVDRISCFMSSYGMQVCVSSYGDKMVFGAASGFRTHNVMLHFFRRLTALGITAEITTNDYETR